jgi:hypothetical protein
MKEEKCVVVISRYNEDVSWLNQLKIPYILYNKGEKLDDFTYSEIPNQGRETETFLRFITEHYHNLPQRVVFVQGDPFYHYKRLLKFLEKPNKNDICFLSDFNPICDAIGRPHHFEELPLKEILKELKIDDLHDTFHFCAGAQYLIPRKYIWSKSLSWWINAYKVNEYYKTGPWAFERLWPLIWNYEEK